jgi:hypothetical protein
MYFKNVCIFAIVICGPLALLAGDRSVDVTFNLLPGSTTSLSGRIGSAPAGFDSGANTGTVEATVVFNEESLTPKNITFTGGRQNQENLDFNFSGNVFVPSAGNFFMSVSVRSSGLSGTLSTINPPGTVSSSGALITSQHLSTLDRGTLSLLASVAGLGSDQEITDYNVSPDSNVFYGTATLVVTEIDAGALERTLQFRLSTFATSNQSELIEVRRRH